MSSEPEPVAITAEMLEYARQLVADWPPFTPEQRTRLAVLLQPVSPRATAPAQKAA
jgi:hypothetical protein